LEPSKPLQLLQRVNPRSDEMLSKQTEDDNMLNKKKYREMLLQQLLEPKEKKLYELFKLMIDDYEKSKLFAEISILISLFGYAAIIALWLYLVFTGRLV
jgi:hypothetical protein